MKRHLTALLFAGLISAISRTPVPAQTKTYTLPYRPAPADNPLKGLVPYAGDHSKQFPHSMEFNYLPLSALLVGERKYDWQPLENLLNQIAGRGHQAVFRVYLEYPNHKDVIPRYLVDQGLKVFEYLNTNTQPFPPAQVQTPDYNDPRLRSALREFILALGKRYDGDARIGFITAGLLGTWGEWHTYPRNELFASKTVQKEVIESYQQAFQTTPILLRYPAGENDGTYASTTKTRMGYHDDSFAWATLDTGKKGEDWFYLSKLRQAGQEAQDRWKIAPIGGEIRPEAWGLVFDEHPNLPAIQDFHTCVQQTHASWLMDTGMFQGVPSESRRKRAEKEVQQMGYEFHIPQVRLSTKRKGHIEIELAVENRGVAPFYYAWQLQYELVNQKGETTLTVHSTTNLKGLLPRQTAYLLKETLLVNTLPKGTYKLLLRVPNPLKQGKSLRFANTTQDRDREGALTLVTALSLP